MHASTTELAKETLSHAKELIKELDAEKFDYDRTGIMTLLSSFTQVYKQANEQSTIEHLEEIITLLERLEHAYHDWVLKKNGLLSIQEIQSILGGFKADASVNKTSRISWSRISRGLYMFFTWFECTALRIILLLFCCLFFFHMSHVLWYAVIITSLATLVTLLLRRSFTLTGRVIVLGMLCSMVWFRESIL